MLVLSRHRDESIGIELPDGRMIEVVVIDIRGDKIKIGINAPVDITVHRGEVWAAIRRERAERLRRGDVPGPSPKRPPRDEPDGRSDGPDARETP